MLTGLLVPRAAVTMMSTVPPDAGPCGTVATIVPGAVSAKTAGTPPNDTLDAPPKPVPEMVTAVPPPTGPLLGTTEAIWGAR